MQQAKAFSSGTRTRPLCAASHNGARTDTSRRQLLAGTAAVLTSLTLPAWQPAQVRCQCLLPRPGPSSCAFSFTSVFMRPIAPPVQAQSLDDDFTVTTSGLKVLDVRPGEGATPTSGDTVVIHWSGYTKGYQVGPEGPQALLREQENAVTQSIAE